MSTTNSRSTICRWLNLIRYCIHLGKYISVYKYIHQAVCLCIHAIYKTYRKRQSESENERMPRTYNRTMSPSTYWYKMNSNVADSRHQISMCQCHKKEEKKTHWKYVQICLVPFVFNTYDNLQIFFTVH